jgi:hypothetical protein
MKISEKVVALVGGADSMAIMVQNLIVMAMDGDYVTLRDQDGENIEVMARYVFASVEEALTAIGADAAVMEGDALDDEPIRDGPHQTSSPE